MKLNSLREFANYFMFSVLGVLYFIWGPGDKYGYTNRVEPETLIFILIFIIIVNIIAIVFFKSKTSIRELTTIPLTMACVSSGMSSIEQLLMHKEVAFIVAFSFSIGCLVCIILIQRWFKDY